jgi:hypothetical protein
MTPGDRRFCERADEFRDWRGSITDARHFPLKRREFTRIGILSYNLLGEIRRRRPDLDVRALAELATFHPSKLPSDGELVMLVDDASDVISETVHAIRTGRVGEYIEAACPSLRRKEEPKITVVDRTGMIESQRESARAILESRFTTRVERELERPAPQEASARSDQQPVKRWLP